MSRRTSANIKATLIAVTAALSLLTSAGSALAFNPQPEPPGGSISPIVYFVPPAFVLGPGR